METPTVYLRPSPQPLCGLVCAATSCTAAVEGGGGRLSSSFFCMLHVAILSLLNNLWSGVPDILLLLWLGKGKEAFICPMSQYFPPYLLPA